MTRPPSFNVISGLERTSHGALALALGGEFAEVDLEDVEAALLDLADDMASIAGLGYEDQLAQVGEVLATRLAVISGRRATTFDDLLFHRVACSGRGSGALCALVAIEAARLANIGLGLIASRSGVYVADPRASNPLVLAPDRGWLAVDVRDLGDRELAWKCPHESAGLILGLILGRARRTGLVGVQLRAAELCLSLPVDDEERERLRMQLATVRAVLN